MFIVSYDITSNKTRAKFAKYLKKFGNKIQYSVYEIRNSQRVLKNIKNEIELRYKKMFKNRDSILIFLICEGCKNKIVKYGYAENEDKEVIYF